MIRLRLGATYSTRNLTAVTILGLVSSDFIGRHHTDRRTGERTFIPVPYYRAQIRSTGEVVFYLPNGNIVSEKPSASDGQLAINREVS